MWEYIKTTIDYKNYEELEKELNDLGNDNWEIIHYYEVPCEKYEIKREVEILAKRPKIVNENKMEG